MTKMMVKKFKKFSIEAVLIKEDSEYRQAIPVNWLGFELALRKEKSQSLKGKHRCDNVFMTVCIQKLHSILQ